MSKIVKSKGIEHIGDMTSEFIKGRLANRHYDDIYVPECKNGPTYFTSQLLKLDAWVLVKSYSPFRTIGYEIKVSRSDFENDQKWTGYLDYCHCFYFVCPSGLIRATDLPNNIGIIWVSSGGNLYVKRSAIRSEPDPEKFKDLLIYVLMSRCTVDAPQVETLSKCEQKKAIIQEANKREELAYFVNGHIKQQYLAMGEKESNIIRRESLINEFAQRLSGLGINWNPGDNSWEESRKVQNEINALKENLSIDDVCRMERLAESLSNTAAKLRKLL